jgi:hypothetical protein
MTGTTAAFRLCTLAIAAGTVLGLASHAAAQSRLERAEKALAQAQKELDAARREAKEGDNQIEVRAEVSGDGQCCQGACGSAEGQATRAELTADDDDEDQPRKIERRIEIRRGQAQGGGESSGEVCPLCGRPMEGGNVKLPGHNIKVFRLGDGEGQGWKVEGGPARVQGKVIIIDGEGGRREFNFGGRDEGRGESHGEGHAEAHAFVIRGDGEDGPNVERRIEIRRRGGEDGQFFMEGDGLKKQERRIEIHGMGGNDEPRIMIDGDGEGRHEGNTIERRIEIRRGQGHGSANPEGFFHMDGGGKVIIITPDGERREINIGGEDGKKHVRIERFGDGEGAAAHPDGQGDRTIRVRRVVRDSVL